MIPAYNEEKRLPTSLDRVVPWLCARTPRLSEIIVVDDGSTDGTAALVEDYARAHPVVRLLRNPGNRGKGYAIRIGMLAARAEWVLYSDADLSTPIEEADKLYAMVRERNASVAIGSRALDRSLVSVHQPVFREYSGRFFNLVMRLMTGLPFDDTQCGFKLFEKNAATLIFSRQILDGFSFDVEDLYIARQCGIRVVEVPVRWANVEGSKVQLMQGLRSFGDLIAIRRNGMAGKYRC